MHVKQLITELERLAPTQRTRVMNVCGGHERTISQSGLRSLLPKNLELIPGPGCPVCVCPESIIASAIDLSLREGFRLLSFGDMLRVPINASKGAPRSLLQAREIGGRVQAVSSPQEVIELAQRYFKEKIVFFVAGFETTMAPIAAMLSQPLPDNLYFLLAGRRTWPIVDHLLANHTRHFDALLAPGHVATITGADEWQQTCYTHRLPCAVAGFEIESFLRALLHLLQQLQQGTDEFANVYSGVASTAGNRQAQHLLDEHFLIANAPWRGIGEIPLSGYGLRPQNQQRDASQFIAATHQADLMPKGCDCARVVLGQIYPDQCQLYGRSCTPSRPIGPCMVSDEGACQLWWSSGVRQAACDAV